jgi:hypothetical protein
MSNWNGWAGGAIIAAFLSVAVMMIATKETPKPDDPAAAAREAAAAASAAEHDEDVRLYRESVAELEAVAHDRYMSVEQLAASQGTDRKTLIGLTYALKKTRAQAIKADQRAAAGATSP